mgnify:CR=1 FL=1
MMVIRGEDLSHAFWGFLVLEALRKKDGGFPAAAEVLGISSEEAFQALLALGHENRRFLPKPTVPEMMDFALTATA